MLRSDWQIDSAYFLRSHVPLGHFTAVSVAHGADHGECSLSAERSRRGLKMTDLGVRKRVFSSNGIALALDCSTRSAHQSKIAEHDGRACRYAILFWKLP